MYKIGIDARLIDKTGIGVYLRNLIYYLQKLAPKNYLFYLYLLAEDKDKIVLKNNFQPRLVNYRWHSFSEQIYFFFDLVRDDLDLVHFTYFSYPILYKKKFIATIHDLTPFFFKTGRASSKNILYYYLKHLIFSFVLSQQIKNAAAIITPTKFVKKQLLSIFKKTSPKKVIPIYEGINYELLKTAEIKITKKFSKPFFIYVGNFYPHKNLERLILAFKGLEEKYQLVLIGPEDFFSRRLKLFIAKLNLQKQIGFCHDPEKEQLVFFYKNALALIHPSLSEGFGLPIIEASHFGLPIIASNIKVFKEILKDEFLAFNPYNVGDIRLKIRQFLKERAHFQNKKMSERFSFEKMALETLKIYRKILGS